MIEIEPIGQPRARHIVSPSTGRHLVSTAPTLPAYVLAFLSESCFTFFLWLRLNFGARRSQMGNDRIH